MVIWTHRARTDLKTIHDYIAKDSQQNAQKVTHLILQKCQSLLTIPHSGKKVSGINQTDLREIGVYSWRIIYHINNNDIFIVTVVHQRRNASPQELTP